MKQTD